MKTIILAVLLNLIFLAGYSQPTIIYDELEFTEDCYFDANVGIGTTTPRGKLDVVTGMTSFVVLENSLVYFDALNLKSLQVQDSTGNMNSKAFGIINGMNFSSYDPTDIMSEMGLRDTSGAHIAAIECHGDTTGAGHVHIDVRNAALDELQLHFEAGDSSIDIITNGTEINITASDSLNFQAGIIQNNGIVFNIGTGTFLTNQSTSEGRLFFVEDLDNGTNTIRLSSPASLSASYNFFLPPNIGTTGQVLQSTGTATSWISPATLSQWTTINDSTVAYIYNDDTLFIGVTNVLTGGVGLTTDGSLILGDVTGSGNYILNEPNADAFQVKVADTTRFQVEQTQVTSFVDLIPADSAVQNLGSLALPFDSIFASNNSLFLGNPATDGVHLTATGADDGNIYQMNGTTAEWFGVDEALTALPTYAVGGFPANAQAGGYSGKYVTVSGIVVGLLTLDMIVKVP